MEVKVLGPGCARCKQLFERVEKAVSDVGVEASLTKIEKMDEIMAYPIMATPALVIDEVVKVSGRVPRPEEIVDWLRAAS